MIGLEVATRLERWPLAEPFVLSRGRIDEVEVVVVEARTAGGFGRGECRPYARYGWTSESVAADVLRFASRLRESATEGSLVETLGRVAPPGAARNALEAALLDLEARRSGVPVHARLCLPAPRECVTAFTLSLDAPAAMARAARAAGPRPVLKLKLGGAGDEDRVAAVREAAPDAVLIADANEAWRQDDLEPGLHALAALRVALVEQPLPAGDDEALARIERPLPVCADESFHGFLAAGGGDEVAALRARYDAVNVKLDKAGGLVAAKAAITAARAAGLSVLLGCMVGTSLAMAPALLLAPLADWVDLDGALLLARDRDGGLKAAGSRLSPPSPGFWGQDHPSATGTITHSSPST